MQKLIAFLKTHKFSAFLILVIVYLLAKNNFPLPHTSGNFAGIGSAMPVRDMAVSDSYSAKSMVAPGDISEEVSAPSQSPDRLVIKDTSLSLQVKDVAASLKSIDTTATSLGGFLVNSNLSTPEGAASGTITVRVPVEKLDEALTSFKQLAIKVVAENVSGRDVTDQYEDLEARLVTLNTTKTKFEVIRDQATKISDLLEVQRQLISLQSQIDNIKGRQQYLTQSAQLARISIYLSTDDLALPYTPDKSWRPGVVFKEATRSLIVNLRSLGSTFIWLIVYSPIILIAYLLYRLIRHKLH